MQRNADKTNASGSVGQQAQIGVLSNGRQVAIRSPSVSPLAQHPPTVG
jgi:hypothetical protein